ncbi:hypothetical protein FE257_008162 [Aspergillus nanangensis]|uniref:N-acetyltransferase domain-containing protein n=1 Tax=Aspergillus nanangensis TaxID=2582783 RepID=A0AAD4CNV4_ASPNN|nr:hypothetical protein FE257_008162 [Aspergillus nanangensis]
MDTIVPILLLSEHIKTTPTNLPLLKAIQKVLNDSYTATYCAHPELFGTSHVRIADPAQLADVIGADGFTIVLVRVVSAGANEKPRLCEVVATGSVKDFGDGDVESYAEWSKNRGGAEWAKEGNRGSSGDTAGQKGGVKNPEVTAFAVSPHCQAAGLGARVLDEIKWAVGIDGHDSKLRNIIAKNSDAVVDGLQLSDSTTTFPLQGIDVNRLKDIIASGKTRKGENDALQDTTQPKLVLMCIRELGNESYYQRRGFKTVWTGTVPLGMWDCKKECTMVYMEMGTD